MSIFKKVGLLVSLVLGSTSAFAGSVTAQLNGGEVNLPSCGGTVQMNNGGNDNQLNVVLRNVYYCSNVILMDGRAYTMKQPQGSRNGSYTAINASDLYPGSYYTDIVVRSDSGAHYDSIRVYFYIN